VIKRLIIILFGISFAVSSSADQKGPSIFIVQHQILSTYEKIKASMLSNLPDKYRITQYNAENDLKDLIDVTGRLKDMQVDLVVCLGTIAAKTVIEKEKEIPIVISGMGAPGYSGIIKNWNSSGRNFTAVECKDAVYESLRILKDVASFSSIGMIYLNKAPSHLGAARQIENFCRDQKINCIASSFDNRNESRSLLSFKETEVRLKKALGDVVPYCDFFYLNTSATFLMHIDTIVDVLHKYKVPSAGADIYLNEGVTLSISLDSVEKGRVMADYIYRILEQGESPSSLPMNAIDTFKLDYNITEGRKTTIRPKENFFNYEINMHL